MKVAVCLSLFALLALTLVQVTMADKGQDTIIMGGDHGCGPKLLLKSGGKKKGDMIFMNDCKHKEYKHETSYIPYPMYYPMHGGGGGHDTHSYSMGHGGYGGGGGGGGGYGGGY